VYLGLHQNELKNFPRTSKKLKIFNWNMNLMKMGLLFKYHCTIKVKKARPHSHLDSRERKVFDQD